MGAPLLSLCVGHFGKLLEDGGSGRKAVGSFFFFLEVVMSLILVSG